MVVSSRECHPLGVSPMLMQCTLTPTTESTLVLYDRTPIYNAQCHTMQPLDYYSNLTIGLSMATNSMVHHLLIP